MHNRQSKFSGWKQPFIYSQFCGSSFWERPLGSSSLSHTAPAETVKARGSTSKMVSHSHVWSLGAYWCLSFSMCHVIPHGFSAWLGLIKVVVSLLLQLAFRMHVAQLKAMSRSGTMSLLLCSICQSNHSAHWFKVVEKTYLLVGWGSHLAEKHVGWEYCCI